ncbi:hypothetical protein EBJ23_22620 [Escherichia coli]|nr:hypothetical protein [Escherichia coli]EEY6223892.1 hypothetical protein [Escherichia coli]
MISFHKNTRNLTVRSVPKKDIAHNIELIIRPLNIPIEKFLSIEYTNVEEFPLTFLKDNYHGALNLVQNRLLNRQENRINADEIIKILLATLRD